MMADCRLVTHHPLSLIVTTDHCDDDFNAVDDDKFRAGKTPACYNSSTQEKGRTSSLPSHSSTIRTAGHQRSRNLSFRAYLIATTSLFCPEIWLTFGSPAVSFSLWSPHSISCGLIFLPDLTADWCVLYGNLCVGVRCAFFTCACLPICSYWCAARALSCSWTLACEALYVHIWLLPFRRAPSLTS